MRKNNHMPEIPAEKFKLVGLDAKLHDQKFETKQVSFFQDALHRFCKNKSSVVAAIIILSLVLYAVFIPVFCSTNYSDALTDTNYLNYVKLAPKNNFFAQFGIWDGTKEMTLGAANYDYFRAIGEETNTEIIKKVKDQITDEKGKIAYVCDVDTYIYNGFTTMTLTADEYQALQNWQNETGVQVIYPAVGDKSVSDANIWYEATKKGAPKLDADGNFINIYKTSGEDGSYSSLRVEGDPGIEDPTSADRNIKCKINKDGIWIEKMDDKPYELIPEELRNAGEGEVVRVDLNRPMDEVCEQLSQYPVSTRLSLNGTIIVGRDIAHAKIKARLDAGEPMPEYLKNHPIYYAGPAKTPAGMACGSMGPTTAGRMDPYVYEFQDHGGSRIMLAKGNRSIDVTNACKDHGGFYLGSIGGPAAILAQNNIKSIECVEYPELGMEAIWKIEVEDFPAFILVDDKGNDFFKQLKPCEGCTILEA